MATDYQAHSVYRQSGLLGKGMIHVLWDGAGWFEVSSRYPEWHAIENL